MNDRPGFAGETRTFRYERARVYRVEWDGGPANEATIEAESITDPRMQFLVRVPLAHMPAAGSLVTFRTWPDGSADLVVDRKPIEHEVKCAPLEFDALQRGDKRHETRVDDRDYRVGDTLFLRMWTDAQGYIGPDTRRVITYKTPGGTWGLPEGLCVLSVAKLGEQRELLDELERIANAGGYHLHADNLAGGGVRLSLTEPAV